MKYCNHIEMLCCDDQWPPPMLTDWKLLFDILGIMTMPATAEVKANTEASANAGMFPFPNSSSHGPAPMAMTIWGSTMAMLRTPVHSPAATKQNQSLCQIRVGWSHIFEVSAAGSPCPPPLLAASCAVTANGTLHRTCIYATFNLINRAIGDSRPIEVS